jgi:lipid A 3-O-deacylase
MLRKYLLLAVFIISSPFIAQAKKLDSLSFTNHKEFLLHWDNDMFLFKDYYYTQGAHLYFINPALRKNPLNHILFRLRNADLYYGLGVVQEIYTPKDVADTLLNLVDRPYAGTLYFRSFISSSIPEKKLRFTSQVDLGFLGPLAGAEQAQKYIHEWLGLEWPKGWDFQIENRPYLNYNLQIEKGLITAPGIFDLTVDSRLRIGNIHDDFQLGGLFRLGRINNLFKGYNLGNKKYTENKDFQYFIYGGTKVTA